tara:strand:- start:749 stop:1048 length:300 start_codon:yes stop_codon:yes gene_type:complete
MYNPIIFGYIAIFFSIIYRLPQIKKIYALKKGGDVSKKTYLLHNMSYIFFLIYLFHKTPLDYLLISYEFIGITQNFIIVILKMYYKKNVIKQNKENINI